MMLRRCEFEGCNKTSEHPRLQGWSYLTDWGPGVPDGYYCPEHKEAIEAIHHEIAERKRLEKAGREWRK
jgi:hypothetical protein